MNSFLAGALLSTASALQLNQLSSSLAQSTTYSYPAAYFDLSLYKLQVPYDSSGSFTSSNSPTTISQSKLKTFSYSPYFYMRTNEFGVAAMVFRTPVQGLTTSGSEHPRFELREMTSSGANAAWSAVDGLTHTFEISGNVTHLTSVSQRAVVMQIFDSTNGPYMEVYATPASTNGGKGLYATTVNLTDDSLKTYYLDKSFDVDKAYTLKAQIYNGVLSIYYNGSLVATESGLTRTALYFKAGDYC